MMRPFGRAARLAITLPIIFTGTLRSVFGPLWFTVARTWRIVLAHWPALIGWTVIGYLGRYVVVEAAGWVGFHNSMLGLAMMPVAILFRLVSLVAVLLVVRDAMADLTAVAPVPASGAARRREFVDSVLAGILPFFAFYFAWNFLAADFVAYQARVYEVGNYNLPFDPTGTVQVNTGTLRLTWFTGTVIVITFVLRYVLRRLDSRSSRGVPVIAVYIESLWVFLSALVIGGLLDRIRDWVFSRQGIAWYSDGRLWISDRLAPLDWLLQFGGWLLGEAGVLIVYPLAWLTIAGVIYGQTITDATPTPRRPIDRVVGHRRIKGAHKRLTALPNWLRSRAREIWDDLVARFRPIGNALALMWRVGPVMIAGYVLLYQGYRWVEAALGVAIPRLFGPQPSRFWLTYSPAIDLIAVIVAAPVGIAIVAATFDSVLARARRSRADSIESADRPPGTFAPPVADDLVT